MRAAFYSRCLDYPELVAALRDRQVVLDPMMAEGLREAVTSPAKAVGLQLDAGAVELMLRDLGVSSARARAGIGQRTCDAGALPLLSHAVLSTWQRREGSGLTVSGYRAAGGVQGAVTEIAERVWAELNTAGQAAARGIARPVCPETSSSPRRGSGGAASGFVELPSPQWWRSH